MTRRLDGALLASTLVDRMGWRFWWQLVKGKFDVGDGVYLEWTASKE